MKDKNITAAVIGGDLRQISAASELKRYGISVMSCGFDTYEGGENEGGVPSRLNADIILLPIPIMRGEWLNMPFSRQKITEGELIQILGDNVKLVVGGKFSDELHAALSIKGISAFDLCENESFNMQNAVPTAEGAVAIAMGTLKTTVFGSKTAVLGFGRIGKVLARMLLSLGSQVTVAARSERDLNEARLIGCQSVTYNELPERLSGIGVVFNTVPKTVLNEAELQEMGKDSFIIDLASRPGGVDCQAASRLGVRVISALSLPGKVAPVSAGRIIAECTVKRVNEVMP